MNVPNHYNITLTEKERDMIVAALRFAATEFDAAKEREFWPSKRRMRLDQSISFRKLAISIEDRPKFDGGEVERLP